MILELLAPLAAYTLPPERFRGDNTVVVTFAKPELVQELCRNHGQERDPHLIGCAEFLPPSMVLPNPCDPVYANEVYARIACHEAGHSRGWTYKHEE